MRSGARADLKDLNEVFKKEVDPQFVRFESGFRSRTVPELERLAALFKAWNDDPLGDKITEVINAAAALEPAEPVAAPVVTAAATEDMAQVIQEHERQKARLQEEIEQLRASVAAAQDEYAGLAQTVDRRKSSEQIIEALVKKLPKSRFDTAIGELSDVLSTDTRAYCRVHGILYAGELWALQGAPEDIEKDIQTLCEKWSVSRDTDLLATGYIPHYWLNPDFYSACSLQVVDVLRPAVNPRRKRMDGYLEPGQKVGEFLRKWKGIPGKQQDFQHFLDKSHGYVIHAACYVAEEWQP
jgi:hypothetical protein